MVTVGRMGERAGPPSQVEGDAVMMPTSPFITLTRASAWAWGCFVFYTIACAWPEVGGWEFVVPMWGHAGLCILYGLCAWWRGWPGVAGGAGGVLGATMLRAAWTDDGAVAACVGFTVCTLACTTWGLCIDDVDEHGRLPTRDAALLLWLTTSLAGIGGLILADALAWLAVMLG